MIRITDVGPRDGLQNESAEIATRSKIAFVDALSATGVDEVEVSSFVSPKAIPQLKDAARVFEGISRKPGVVYSALVPNEIGLDHALEAKVDKIAIFTAASETFNGKNIHATIAESIARFEPVMKRVTLPVRGYISTAVWCPYEGRIAAAAVVEVVRRLLDLGVQEIDLGDTIGKAAPEEIRELLEAVLPVVPKEKIVLHLHDTFARAVENALTGWREFGIESFDASAGGLGGCPYAPGASGNVATEDLVTALKEAGAETGVDPRASALAAIALEPQLGREINSRLSGIVRKG